MRPARTFIITAQGRRLHIVSDSLESLCGKFLQLGRVSHAVLFLEHGGKGEGEAFHGSIGAEGSTGGNAGGDRGAAVAAAAAGAVALAAGSTGSRAAGSGGGGSGDCLIKPIVADRDNITSFRELATGFYTFHGYFTPYFGSDVSMSAPYPAFGSVINDGDISYVQILFPYKNQVQYLEITDNSYKRSDVKLANYGVINVAEFQKVMEYAAKYQLDHACETLSEVITALAEKVSFAKLTVNATDSATGATLTLATHQITSEERWRDGHYHLNTGAYTLKVQCTGYATQSVTVTIKAADIAAGEKVVDIALVKSA